jgi:exosortase A-associated hydrolase 1
MNESASTFVCGGDALIGILHTPEQARSRGILFVVGGGPQYRSGGHRQLTLWSRRLCAEGFPVFRFDYRGMGDSHGTFAGFEGIDDDIRSAIDQFTTLAPGVKEIVLWGECDAASAILFYAHRDARVKGVVLLNPWVRTLAGNARAILRFYYLQRVLQPSFWKKVLRLRFNPWTSVWSALRLVQLSGTEGPRVALPPTRLGAAISREGPLPDRLLQGLTRFDGPVMLVLSGRDLIAREFEAVVRDSAAWQAQFQRKPVTRLDMPEGDHTFSSAAQRDKVVAWGLEWLHSW